MSLFEKIFGAEQKEEDFFIRNRNKKIAASTTMPTEEEVKQEAEGL